jgi:hypothetical protein
LAGAVKTVPQKQATVQLIQGQRRRGAL